MSGSGDEAIPQARRLAVVLTPDPALDAEECERLIRQLRNELSELDHYSMSAEASGLAPDGSKGADPVTLGVLLIALSASGGVFPALVETLRDWLGRHAARNRISVTIDGDTVSSSWTRLPSVNVQNLSMPMSGVIRRSKRWLDDWRCWSPPNNYQDSGLCQLTAPANDAEALAAVLQDPDVSGFEVATLVNEPHHRAGEAIGKFYRNRRHDDLTLLYFTGRGLKDDDGRLYLAMTNTGETIYCSRRFPPSRSTTPWRDVRRGRRY